MNDPDDSKKLKQLGPETTFGDDSLNPSVVDLPYVYEQDRNKSTRSTANDVYGSSGGVEMTSFRRPSAAAASDRERFRRFSQLSSTGVRPEVESQQTPSIRESIARIEEEPTGADAIDRGTVDGGFGWVIVACRSMRSFATFVFNSWLKTFRLAGTFTIAFHFLGFLFSWGVIQSALLEQGLASTRLLSIIGGVATFWNAAGCFPVSSASARTYSLTSFPEIAAPTYSAGRTTRQTFRQAVNRLDRCLDARICLHRLELLSTQLPRVAHPARVGSGVRLRHAVHGQSLVGLDWQSDIAERRIFIDGLPSARDMVLAQARNRYRNYMYVVVASARGRLGP